MMNNNFEPRATCDWRLQLKKNQRRTFFVTALFLLIYAFVGLLVDLYLHLGPVYRAAEAQGIALSTGQAILITLKLLLTFKITPWIMLVLLGVAAVSLFITFALHDRLMLLGTEYHAVKEESQSLDEQQLYHIVEEMKIAAGLNYMPKIYLIEAEYMNAFASGYSEKSALIAVTRGLMNKLDRQELQAVIAHELSHIRHGDIKLTLMASVLSNIMLIVLDLLFYNMLFSRDKRNNEGNGLLLIIMILRFLLPLLTICLMFYLSRTREYMADAGSVELMRDNHPLGSALLKISGDYDDYLDEHQTALQKTSHEDVRRAAYIFDPFADQARPVKSLTSLTATHPSIPDRLKALGFDVKGK